MVYVSFKLNFQSGNRVFEDNPYGEMQRILTEVVLPTIEEEREVSKPVRDEDGNTIGHLNITVEYDADE